MFIIDSSRQNDFSHPFENFPKEKKSNKNPPFRKINSPFLSFFTKAESKNLYQK